MVAMVEALVLAGGKTSESLQKLTNAENEAFIEIGPKKMIQYVIEALQKSKRVSRVIVVGPRELREIVTAGVILQAAGKTIIENLRLGLTRVSRGTEKLLVVSADIPFLTGKVIDNFLGAADDYDADFYYPIIAKDTCERHFPEVKRTYVKLKEGIFTGGNIFLLNPEIITKCSKEAEELIANRKYPLKMLKLLGIQFLIKFFFKRLSINDLEKKVSGLFKIKGVALISRDAEIGVDVDKDTDLELARKHLGY